MPFEDHFGGHAAAYARHRPAYPPALFDRLAEAAPNRVLAWDVGCGSGQAARGLAERFDTVVACDGSLSQLAVASLGNTFGLFAGLAEAPPIGSRSVDLVTVAQALHWLDLPAFYRAVRRVAQPGGVIAAWCYTLPSVSAAVDPLIACFHDRVVGPYWPHRRRHVLNAYESLDFPFPRLDAPELTLEAWWTLDDLLGYLGTWSAARRFTAATGLDPLAAIGQRFSRAWSEPQRRRAVRWPIHLLIGRLPR